MPRIKSAKKRLRQNKKRRERNRIIKGHLRRLEKDIRASDDPKFIEPKVSQYFSEVDKAAKKSILHKNKADRKKGQLAKHLNKAK